ncbi:MAG: DUF721 domain-containing protein [Candidatus Firestonebacteria bacterium]|nr:DUF721 domain-containing protein [Candidatus Firestonebacteria bacterium]
MVVFGNQKPDKKISSMVNNISSHLDLNQTILLDEIKKAWHGMGSVLFTHAIPVVFKNGNLTMAVKNTDWHKQLAIFKNEIKVQLNRYFGFEVIKNIEFKIVKGSKD